MYRYYDYYNYLRRLKETRSQTITLYRQEDSGTTYYSVDKGATWQSFTEASADITVSNAYNGTIMAYTENSNGDRSRIVTGGGIVPRDRVNWCLCSCGVS